MTDDQYLAVAVQAARRAASVVVDAARDLKRTSLHARNYRDLVSAAETDTEDAIIATLRSAFPSYAIIGRDSGEVVSEIVGRKSDARKSFKWIIDPIDGGANFARGYSHYAVSIALTYGGDVTHAVVLDPVHDEIYTAIKGKGAQRNGTSIQTSTSVRLDAALIATVMPSPASPKLQAYLAGFNALAAQCSGLRRSGSPALDLAHVACGRLDGFWGTTLKPWNIAAGALIVAEAGGRVDDFGRGVGAAPSSEVIAATTGVFTVLREVLAKGNG